MNRKLKLDELERVSVDEFKLQKKSPIIVILDNIRSLHNIGSVFRTCDAFNVECIYLCGITATPPHREIQKSALGATESVDWKYIENTLTAIELLKKEDCHIISLEQTSSSIDLNKFIPVVGKKMALVFGNEVNGVSNVVINLSDSCVEIPQFGTKHSFNISVSVGIVLWDLVNKLG